VTLDVDEFDRAADAARDTEEQEKAAHAARLRRHLLPEDPTSPDRGARDRLRLRHLSC
jgi:hypothetical protein